jgi:hypothetical protein
MSTAVTLVLETTGVLVAFIKISGVSVVRLALWELDSVNNAKVAKSKAFIFFILAFLLIIIEIENHLDI